MLESKLWSYMQELEYDEISPYQYVSYRSFNVVFVYRQGSRISDFPLQEKQCFSFIEY